MPLVRLSLAEIKAQGELEGPKRRLLVCNGTIEASVIYFRAGYTPNDYPSEVRRPRRLRNGCDD